MKYLCLVILIVFSCKEKSDNLLVGKWKLLGPSDTETNTDIEFTKSQYKIISLLDKSVETYDYVREGNKLIGKKASSPQVDTTIIQIINNDSIIATTPAGIYATLVRYKN